MPESARHLEKAEKHLQKGRLDAALREYQEVLAEEPGHEVAAQAAADLCLKLGYGKEAVRLLQDLFERQATAGQVTAAATYKKLAKLTAVTADQSLRTARLLESVNRKEALDTYESALQDFTRAGDSAGAITVLEALVALEPTTARLQQLAELLAGKGDNKRAAILLYRAADILLREGKSDAALPLYQGAYALDNTDLRIALAYARVLLAAGVQHAAKVLEMLQPYAHGPAATPESRAVYGEALLALGRAREAEPFLWEIFEHDPGQVKTVLLLVEQLLQAGDTGAAVDLARRLEQHQQHAGRLRQHAALMSDLATRCPGNAEWLEYLVDLFNTANHERDYCATLIKLFDLYYAAGNFLRATECLDRAAEVDPYEDGHKDRLAALRGKVDANRLRNVANRLAGAVTTSDQEIDSVANSSSIGSEDEPTVLEDLMLQAEIFLQYSLRSRAVERLERIRKLFPGEELKNDKLRDLFVSAGLEVAKPAPSVAAGPMQVRSVADEAAVDNIARVTDITRNIARQGSAKSVLFTAVNEIGRHWNASRCVAVLCTPGKPPSIALEYCAPGIAPSNVHAIVKLVALLQPLLLAHGTLVVDESASGPLASLRQVAAGIGVTSLLAVPLVEGQEHSGLMLLAQCGAPRNWRPTDTVVFKTIADQVVLALANARLRTLVKSLSVAEQKSGLLKRSSYLDVLLSEVRRAQQQGGPLTVMLMSFGNPEQAREHGASTELLMEQVGQLVSAHIRQNDLAVRYDAATVALVLADTNDKNAFFAADKLRKVLASTRANPLTFGIAEAVLHSQYDAADIVTELVNRAEMALQTAFNGGGNNAHALAAVIQSSATA
ncbi:MAG: tetratricopeptide repeat protein [Terriglobales bacterium]